MNPMILSRFVLTATCLASFMLMGCSDQPKPEEARKASDSGLNRAPVSGLDVNSFDTTIHPGDDFFGYVNNQWIAENAIPADKNRWGTFSVLRENAKIAVRQIIEDAAAGDNPKGSDAQRIGDLYASFQDFELRDSLGIAPIQPFLEQIDSLTSHDDVAAYLGLSARLGFNSPIALFAYADAKNPGINAMYLGQSGIGLPEREYYFKNDEKSAALRDSYRALIEDQHALAGLELDEGDIAVIYGLEEAIAQQHMTKEQSRNFADNYTRFDEVDLPTLMPTFNWEAYLSAYGLKSPGYLVSTSTDYFTALDTLLSSTPIEDLKSYLKWQLLNSQAARLTRALDDRNFDFYGRALRGTEEQEADWRRAVSVVDAGLGELVGKEYVARHFPSEAKERMETLVDNLINAYKDSVTELDWMTSGTKKEALDKLSKFEAKIGHPETFREYRGVEIDASTYFANRMALREADVERDIARHGGPVDRDEWGMNPQTVNAYYTPILNQIVFPAAILQPPFFDLNADDAVNYGGIGAVIGHEIGHGVDDQGSKYDGDGNIRMWWTDQDRAEFEKRTGALVDQYNGYYVFDDLHVNGEFTLGENIGDLGGISIALKAYKMSLGDDPAPVIDGLTGEQRVFLGFAQIWRIKEREESLRTRIATDPHSPGEFRANGSVRNVSEWYDAFNVTEEHALYLSPEERVKIW